MAQDPGKLPGLSEEITVKPAKELSVKAPSGNYVAVLDNRLADPSASATASQDHHNGWLELSSGKVSGNVIKVKGKYYVPSTAAIPPKGLRFTIRKRSPAGLKVYSDKTLDIDPTMDKWIDFSIELPLDEAVDPEPLNYALLLSALPFAGPIYLDNVEVTDPMGNGLWDHPEFELE